MNLLVIVIDQPYGGRLQIEPWLFVQSAARPSTSRASACWPWHAAEHRDNGRRHRRPQVPRMRRPVEATLWPSVGGAGPLS
jgi:hypothetical protein